VGQIAQQELQIDGFELEDSRNHRKRGPQRSRGARPRKRRRHEVAEEELEAEVAYAIGLMHTASMKTRTHLLAVLSGMRRAYFQVLAAACVQVCWPTLTLLVLADHRTHTPPQTTGMISCLMVTQVLATTSCPAGVQMSAGIWSEQEAASKILPKHRHLVSTAWSHP